MTIIPPPTFFIVNNSLAVPALTAPAAKRTAFLFAPSDMALGSWNTRTARPATPEETKEAQTAWIAKVEAQARVRADREANPTPTPAQMLAILEEAEAVIYDQATPRTNGQAGYDRAQRFRNGVLEKAIAALKRDIAP